MVKSTESRKFARATKPLSRIQGIASHDDIPTELLDDHRALEPPDPIPNSVVKRRIADGSVVLHHVRVGHRQAPIRNPSFERGWGFFFVARNFAAELVPAIARGALRVPPVMWSQRCARRSRATGADECAFRQLREQSSLLQAIDDFGDLAGFNYLHALVASSVISHRHYQCAISFRVISIDNV